MSSVQLAGCFLRLVAALWFELTFTLHNFYFFYPPGDDQLQVARLGYPGVTDARDRRELVSFRELPLLERGLLAGLELVVAAINLISYRLITAMGDLHALQVVGNLRARLFFCVWC